VLLEKCSSIFMQGSLKWGAELEPSLFPLIRVIGYTKMLFYAIFWVKKNKLLLKSKNLKVLG